MKEIPLTRGYTALVDDADWPFLSLRKWTACVKPSGNVYAVSYFRENGKVKVLRMHTLVSGISSLQEIDHVDGNTLNNQSRNLRACSRSENCRNTRNHLDAFCKYKGVDFHRASKSFRARIYVLGERIHLGLFDKELDAAHAYDSAALKYFGEFARINFPKKTKP